MYELTRQESEPSCSRERIIAGRIKYVQLIEVTPVLVVFAVEVLNRRNVAFIKWLVAQESLYNVRFARSCTAHHHQTVALLH